LIGAYTQAWVIDRLPAANIKLPLVPGTFEYLILPFVAYLSYVRRGDQGAQATVTEWAGAVRTTVEQSVVGPVDVEDANLMAVHHHNPARAGREVSGVCYDMAIFHLLLLLARRIGIVAKPL
jgi:hypothetical protein